MVKLGTLYPDGRVDDLGELDQNTGVSTPGEDSKRRYEEYGWITAYEDTSALYVSAVPEYTGDFSYVLGISVDPAEKRTERYYSEVLKDGCDVSQLFEDEDEVKSALMALPDRNKHAMEWWDHNEEDGPLDDEEVEQWADEHIESETWEAMYVGLHIIPVNLSGQKIRDIVGDEDAYEHLKESFLKHGDWRAATFDLHMHGSRVCVREGTEWVLEGESPTKSIIGLKQLALQVTMMPAFFLDRQQNAIGETGWDWLRNFGVLFPGDTVIWDRDGEDVECELVWVNWSSGIVELRGKEHWVATVAMHKVRNLDWLERLQRRRDNAKARKKPDETAAG